MFSSWLERVTLEQNKIELQAANHNPKEKDNTFYILLDLFDKGYDMVSWVVTDHETKCELCTFYNNHKTTWRLSEFLGLTRQATINSDITITAAYGAWEELDDSDKLKILRTPNTAYSYAKSLDFDRVPEQVIEEISKNETLSEYFLERFLSVNEVDTVPQSIIDAVGSDAPFVDRLFRELGNQSNFPKDLKFRGMTEEEIALEDQKNWNSTALRYEAPLFEHSHPGCKCQLMVWKSDNPSDVVFVDATGRI